MLALALAGVALAGCGGGKHESPGKNAKRYFGDQRAVAQVVDDLGAASRSGDTKRICSEIFSAQLAKSVAAQAGGSCEAEVKKQLVTQNEDITVQQLAISGSRALATVKEQSGKTSRLVFTHQDGSWRIDSIQ